MGWIKDLKRKIHRLDYVKVFNFSDALYFLKKICLTVFKLFVDCISNTFGVFFFARRRAPTTFWAHCSIDDMLAMMIATVVMSMYVVLSTTPSSGSRGIALLKCIATICRLKCRKATNKSAMANLNQARTRWVKLCLVHHFVGTYVCMFSCSCRSRCCSSLTGLPLMA